uniref:ribosomal protein L19 n=1 Tax=Neustupella aerophytica TaxID=2962111 RepID=UPI00218218F7|nr:ribosomal protein L19 [Neustupella aerophytica]YP_010478875.1 ribosomal protein L19 [Neustupella aerophytica]UVI61110.1 ribosomal protein L19 [Neustupella aerophytica]UVI61180.1 ribosomal protein L19 [Neustupella aerophytica]
MSVSPVSWKSSSVGKIPESKFPTIGVGDTIRVGVLLIEGNKERTQFFEGTVIAIKKREGRRIVRVRKLSQGIGIEKLFLLDSPKVVSVERKKITKVRRAKLYFLRGLGSTKPKKLKDQSWKLKSGS